MLPFGKAGWTALWQAESGFGYRMAGGRLGSFPPAESRWLPVLQALAGGEPSARAERMLPSFLARHGVDAVVVTSRTRRGPRRLIESLETPPLRVADALVWIVPQTDRHTSLRPAAAT